MERKRDSFFLADKKPKSEFRKNKELKNNNKQNKDKKVHFKNNAVNPERTEQLTQEKNKRQEEFNKNRPGLEQDGTEKVKKPFDKKTYRLKKYSKKYKLDQFEEQRKKKLLRNYYKEVQNEQTNGTYKAKVFDEEDTTDGQGTVGRFVKHPDLIEKESSELNALGFKHKEKKDPLAKAKERFNKIKQDKIEKQKEIEKAKEERMQKLQEYKKKKQERFKKLSKKTKKGQPVMTGRLELLLEKIQKNK